MLDWLATVANPREHGTTHVPPIERFRTEEQRALQPLPARPYRSLVLPAAPRRSAPTPAVPVVAVERRSLAAYAQLTAAGGEP